MPPTYTDHPTITIISCRFCSVYTSMKKIVPGAVTPYMMSVDSITCKSLAHSEQRSVLYIVNVVSLFMPLHLDHTVALVLNRNSDSGYNSLASPVLVHGSTPLEARLQSISIAAAQSYVPSHTIAAVTTYLWRMIQNPTGEGLPDPGTWHACTRCPSFSIPALIASAPMVS